MIAVDAGSNQISVLRINPTARSAWSPWRRSPPAASCRSASRSHGDLVYVANAGAGGSNYTGFRLRPDGRLDPIPGSTVALPADAAPGDVLFNGTGTKLAGTEVGTSVIDSFTVGSDGRLTAAPGSPFQAQGLGPFGSEFRPTNPASCSSPTRTTPPPTAAPSRRSPTPRTARCRPIGGLPVRRRPDGPVLGGDHP